MWAFSLVLAVSILSCIEGFWRSLGYRPTLVDDTRQWCLQRDRVNSASENTVVLIGHSRIHQAFVGEEFYAALPGYDFVQLGLFNAEPISVLRDIVENTAFAGTVLVSVAPFCFIPDVWLPQENDPYRCKVVEYYHTEWNLKHRTDRLGENLVERNLVSTFPDLAPHRVLPDIVRGEWPRQWVWLESDRTQFVDYQKADLDRYAQRQLEMLEEILKHVKSNPGYDNWPQPERLARLNDYIRMIQDRGGNVVFLRPVTSGEFGQRIADDFPREKFWDEFARSTIAPTVHYADVPELREMVCADGSHLFRDDAKTFTRILCRELVRLGAVNGTRNKVAVEN